MFKLMLGVRLGGGEVVELSGGVVEPLTVDLVVEKVPERMSSELEADVLVVMFKL